jgi:phosphoribosylanthranilate isomerase
MPVRIKICGVTNEADAVRAAERGADALGLNFHPGSVRYVSPETAQAIVRALPPFIEAVGVFVERSWDEIADTLKSVTGMQWVQRHGRPLSEPPPRCLHVLPAFQVRDQDSLKTIMEYLESCRAQTCLPAGILVDAYDPHQHGGTGKTAPWHLLADFRPGVPLILAGGLTPDNVAEAIRTVRPYAVDVASGVESQPGLKDTEKMKRFIENARCVD